MYWNYTDIYNEITENWQQLEQATYPDDLLNEWADRAVPIYSNDVIKDWQLMPSEFDNSFQEHFGGNIGDLTIIQLMQIDLYEYYRSEYARIYEVVKTEREGFSYCANCNAEIDDEFNNPFTKFCETCETKETEGK